MKSFLSEIIEDEEMIESLHWQDELVSHDDLFQDNHLDILASSSSSSSFSSDQENNENNNIDEESVSSASVQQGRILPNNNIDNEEIRENYHQLNNRHEQRHQEGQQNQDREDNNAQHDEINNNVPIHQPQHHNAATGGTQEGLDQVLYSKILSNIRNHQRHNDLLFQVARSEELALIRADIHWPKILEELPSYPNESVGDVYGSVLLQSILRMDAPILIVEKCIEYFPKCCVNMDPFYVACQYASEETVKLVLRHTVRARKEEGLKWGMVAFLGDARISKQHAMLLLQSTPKALLDPNHGHFGVSPLDRMISGAFIHGETGEWVEKLKLALEVAERGFIDDDSWYTQDRHNEILNGDSHKKSICENHNNDEELMGSCGNNTVDMKDKTFLKRKRSQCEHHDHDLGCNSDTSINFTTTKKNRRQKFYPFHALIRRLISPDFMGVQFGELTFTRTLMACMKCSMIDSSIDEHDPDSKESVTSSDAWKEHSGPFHQLDEEGNLPIHIALNQTCNTNLGVKGERKLIYFLLHSFPQSAMIRSTNGKGDLPLRLSVANGWPCYDLIHNSCPQACHEPFLWGDESGDLSLHVLLDGVYHYRRFGIAGARKLVQYFIKKNPKAAKTLSGRGTLPLHLALKYGWPCHDLIFTAAPMALETRDFTNGLYPFQIFAAKSMNNEDRCVLGKQHHLNALFELIREGPLTTHGMAK